MHRIHPGLFSGCGTDLCAAKLQTPGDIPAKVKSAQLRPASEGCGPSLSAGSGVHGITRLSRGTNYEVRLNRP